MPFNASLDLWILSFTLVASALGILLAKKPVHASLCFLLTLMALATTYIQLSAEFIGVMQILVYAGAILVLFMFVIILFQDAHEQIAEFKAESQPYFLTIAGVAFIGALALIGVRLLGFSPAPEQVPENFGTVQQLGYALYVDFFFPFEAIILIFLVAMVGALYIGRREA